LDEEATREEARTKMSVADPEALEAFELLNVIRAYADIDPMLPIRVRDSARLRHNKIRKNATIDDFGITELRTRAHLIKEAHSRLVGELSAFVSATDRHEKGVQE
jgi:hypothetical protein